MIDREKQKKQVKELYKQKLSFTEIEKRVGITHTTARRWLIQMGLYENRNVTTQSNIIEMYKSGKGSIEIAMDLGLTRTYVLAVLKDKKIKTDEETKVDDLESSLANITLEKMMIDGVMYEDVTPLIFAEG